MTHPLRGKLGDRVGLMLELPHGAKIYYALKFGFVASNNEAKYEAFIVDLKLTKDMGQKS